MDRLIFHIDVNSAFLSWSAVKRLREDPSALDLRLVPSAVGGDVKTRHGIITAKSLPAKRYGVVTGEPVAKALQKCPDLILIRSDFQTYREYSAAFIEILRSYSPILEQVSIDEAFLDMTDRCADPISCAREIRNEIKNTLGFTVNVGISSNKLLAKMASDFEKPDKTHTLWPSEIPEKMWPLPIISLYGCGPKTADRLTSFGITTIGAAAGTPLPVLTDMLGNNAGSYIHESAKGLSSDIVHTQEEKAKSYSNETTLPEDITSENYERLMPACLLKLSSKVAGRLKRDGVFASTVTVIVKTSGFKRHTRQAALPQPTCDDTVIYESTSRLMQQLTFAENGLFSQDAGIRLVGIGCSGLDDGSFRQLGLSDWIKEQELIQKQKKQRLINEEKEQRLQAMLSKVQSRYGSSAIHKGSDL